MKNISPEISVHSIDHYGHAGDRVIEWIGSPIHEPQSTFEVGYYAGDSKPKPIIGISAMSGCPAACNFCELGDAAYNRPLTPDEIYEQVSVTRALAWAIDDTSIDTMHKVNIAKSGEPLLNRQLPEAMDRIAAFGYSFKISTVFPKGPVTINTLAGSARFAAEYDQPVQLQISIISTSDEYRARAVGKLAAPLETVAEGVQLWNDIVPSSIRRKANVSIILSDDTPANPAELVSTLPPDLVNVRLRDYIPTYTGAIHDLSVIQESRYQAIAEQFESFGYSTSRAGRPTQTERTHSLASNVTLQRKSRERKS